MKVFFDDKKLVIITSTKPIHFDLPIEVNKALGCEIKFIISRNESLAEYATKNKISQPLFKHKHKHEKQQFEKEEVSYLLKV